MSEIICAECSRECTEPFRFRKGYRTDDNYHAIFLPENGKVVPTIICEGCLQWSHDNKFCRECGEISPSCGFYREKKKVYAPMCRNCSFEITMKGRDYCSQTDISIRTLTKYVKCRFCERLCCFLRYDKYKDFCYHYVMGIGIICQSCLEDKRYCVGCGTLEPRLGWYDGRYNLADTCIDCYIIKFNIFNAHLYSFTHVKKPIKCRKCKKECKINYNNAFDADDDTYHIKIAKKDKKKIHIYCQGCLKWSEKKP